MSEAKDVTTILLGVWETWFGEKSDLIRTADDTFVVVMPNKQQFEIRTREVNGP